MKTLIIDNYDSFTYNLVHLVEKFTDEVYIMRNDNIDLGIVESCDKIILSPGPGLPDNSGELKNIIKSFSKTKSILGVCLGHQAIAEVFGLKILNMNQLLHGVCSELTYVNLSNKLFKGLSEPIVVAHYHSWVIDRSTFVSNNWDITAKSGDLIMAISHKFLDLHGIQFHPESILTPAGEMIIKNWYND